MLLSVRPFGKWASLKMSVRKTKKVVLSVKQRKSLSSLNSREFTSISKLTWPKIYRRGEEEKEEKEIRRFFDRRYENYFTALSTTRSSLRGSEAQKRCLHSGSSSCDRYHAGERNIVIRPITEIDNRSTARPYTCPKGANACPQHRSSLACLLPFLIRRIKCNLLDNVRRVHLSYPWKPIATSSNK